MSDHYFMKVEKDLKQISDMLLLNGTLTQCAGLVHGKMGIVVFFFHYAQLTGNSLYADYAMDLISEVLNQIHINTPADYETGMSGVGVGFDYLITNNFLDVDEDICEDFDQRMIRAVMYDPWVDFSVYNGLIGYGRYWIKRLSYQNAAVSAKKCLFYIVNQIEQNFVDISITEQIGVYAFLSDLYGVIAFDKIRLLLNRCATSWNIQLNFDNHNLVDTNQFYLDRISHLYQYNNLCKDGSQSELKSLLKQVPELDYQSVPSSSGLLVGYAGEGMMRVTALDPNNVQWLQLL